FRLRGLTWTESQLRQAQKPEGAEAIINPNGTAPALWCPSGTKLVVALPGPPSEFIPLVEKELIPRLAERLDGQALFSRVLRVVG
ncbi:competence/damage-inducible protein A, partial [Parvimonas sp. D9]|nr:competence/damage-inducible protein A [Parvimonas sp. D9]